MSNRAHNRSLDGIRGLAIACVLMHHGVPFFTPSNSNQLFLKWADCGWTGVDLFFILSGFLITGILIDTADSPNRAGSFYARRVLRIFPIYYLTLIGFIVLQLFSAAARHQAPLDGWPDHLAYLFYFQNWIPLWHSGTLPASCLGHFWSLGVEEQFYFVWPVVVWRLRRPSKIFAVSVISMVAMLLLRFVLVRIFGPGIWYMSFTITRGEGLLMGGALAAWIKQGRTVRPSAMAILFAIGAGGFLWASLTNRGMTVWVTVGISLVVMMWAALVATAATRASLFTPLWTWRPLTVLGRYSYGLYIYHLPLYAFSGLLLGRLFGIHPPFRTGYALIHLAVVICVSFCVAWVSYELVEQRFLRLKSRFEAQKRPVHSPVADACLIDH